MHWNLGREFAKNSELLQKAVWSLEKAQGIAKKAEIDETSQMGLQTLLDETQKNILKNEKEKQEQAALFLKKEKEEKEKKRVLERASKQKKRLAEKRNKRAPRGRTDWTTLSREFRLKGILLYKKKKLSRAISAYKMAMKYNALDYELYRLLGEAYATKGDLRKALHYYSIYVSLCSKCKHTTRVRNLIKRYKARLNK